MIETRSIRRPARPAIAAALSALLLASAGLAQPAADAPSPDEIKEAAGVAMKANDCETASALYDAFAESIAEQPDRVAERYTARFLAGVCYERLDQLDKAAAAFREVAYSDAPEALIQRVTPRLEAIEQLLPVKVTFICDEPKVTITLEAIDETPQACDVERSLPPGNYRGKAQSPDGREAVLIVRVQPSIPEEVVVLMPAAGGPRALVAPPTVKDESPSRSRALDWTLTAGAVAAVGAGIGFNMAARDAVERGDLAFLRYEQARAVYNRDAADAAQRDVEAARDDANAAAIASYVFLGAGAVLTGAALWVWLDGPLPGDEPSVSLVPAPGGVGLVGTW